MLNRFRELYVEDWQQFDNVKIEFHDRLTIVTGANGSGKTTLLNLLARHTNWNIPSMAVPKKDKIKGLFAWFTGNDKSLVDQQNIKVGHIVYENSNIANLFRPSNIDSAQFSVTIQDQQQVDGFFIPSHRSVYGYQKLENLPIDTSQLTKLSAFQRVSGATMQRYLGNSQQRQVNYHLKEVLVAWSTFGYGNPTMEGQPYLLECFEGFEEVLKKLLPETLGFKGLKIENFEVVLDCSSGSFMIDASSGGITAIIDMAWQIFMFSEDKEKHFTVMIDEVENHLHPTLQRRILNDLLEAFPNLTFIVSTHSPLIVSSVKNSNVYALRYDSRKRVYSEKLDLVKNVKTATQVLDEVLGVSTTLPMWAEESLTRIVDGFSLDENNIDSSLKSLKDNLDESGLGALLPDAVESIAKRLNS